jgi:hypothetical protein
VAARGEGQGGAIASGRQKEGAPKEGGKRVVPAKGGDKYDICPRAPETLAPALVMGRRGGDRRPVCR